MRITSKLRGGMRFDTEIRGHTLVMDTPAEKGGTDTGPMPPEATAAALGSCVGIYAVHFCRKHGIATDGLEVHTDWEQATHPSRIARMDVSINLPAGVPEDKREAFMRTVEQCLIHKTFCECPAITMKLEE